MSFLSTFRTASILAVLLLCSSVQAGQNRVPADYVDDVYHCDDPWSVQGEEFSISCDRDTFLWNLDELEEGQPPEVCEGQTELTEREVRNAENWFEPCVLWAMLYGNLQPTSEPTTAPTVSPTDSTPPPTIPDDLYHCRDPEDVDRQRSISCDRDTQLWQVDELRPDRPPRLCGDDFFVAPEEVPNVQDWFEPCVLWAMLYGNLTEEPTATPTRSPIQEIDVDSGISDPIEDPSESPQTTEAPEVEDSSVVPVDPIALTLVWPSVIWEAAGGSISLDRFELKTLTERHVREALEAQIGTETIESVDLDLSLGQPRPNQWTEAITGEIRFVDSSITDALPKETLQRFFQQAFSENGLALFLFRLQIAEDPALRLVQEVFAGDVDGPIAGSRNPEVDEDSDDGLDILLLVTIAAVSAALVALCICVYCVFCRKPHKTYYNPRGTVIHVKGDTEEAVKASDKFIPHVIDQIPTIPTKSSSMDKEDVYVDEENQEGSLSNFTMSELDDNSYIGGLGNAALMGLSAGNAQVNPRNMDNAVPPDDQSVGTSIYSYYNDDQSLLAGAAVSSAFSVNSSFDTKASHVESATNKSKKKGVLWSVMDTLQNHFGNDSYTADEDLSNDDLISPVSQSTMGSALGSQPGQDVEKEDKSLLFGNSARTRPSTTSSSPQVVLDDTSSMNTPVTNEDETFSLNTPVADDDSYLNAPPSIQDEVDDYTAGSSTFEAMESVDDEASEMNTPAKERLERLWQQDDDEEAAGVGPSETVSSTPGITANGSAIDPVTLKKSNLSARGASVKVFQDGGPSSLNSSYETDETDEEPASAMLADAGKLFSSGASIGSEQDAESTSMSETKIVNRIPSAEQDDMVLPLPSQLLANNDGMSQSSSHSGHSSQSSGSFGRRLFGGIAGSAKKRLSLGNASVKSNSSNKSGQSTDSAKYRSLLNQMDTNDAALYGLANDSVDSEDVPSPAENAQLSHLIQSFDAAWSEPAEETTTTVTPAAEKESSVEESTEDVAPAPESTTLEPKPADLSSKVPSCTFPKMVAQKPKTPAPIDINSDEEDIYLEDEDEDEGEVNNAEQDKSAAVAEEKVEESSTSKEVDAAKVDTPSTTEVEAKDTSAAAPESDEPTPTEQPEASASTETNLPEPSTSAEETVEEQEEIEVDMDDNVSIKSDSHSSAAASVSHDLQGLLGDEENDEDEKDEVGSFDGVEERLPFENEKLEENMVLSGDDEIEKQVEAAQKPSEDAATTSDAAGEPASATDDSSEEGYTSVDGYTSTMASF